MSTSHKCLTLLIGKPYGTIYKTRLPRPLHQAWVCLVYWNESSSIRGELLELFEVGNRVKQDCILDPHAVLDFSMVLFEAFTNSARRIWIQGRSKTKLFNASQFKSARKIRDILLLKLMFTDDTTFVAHNY